MSSLKLKSSTGNPFGSKVKPKDFLPYPDWRPSTAEADGPDQPTKFILTELIKTRQIPMHVFASLITRAEEER
jgi:hypothetical protein